MTKHLRIEFSNGLTFDIPATVIAHSRAIYYANKDIGEQSGEPSDKWTAVYKEEREFTLNEDEELYDWAANNMDWDDVKEDAIRVETKKEIDWQDEWLNNDKEIIGY